MSDYFIVSKRRVVYLKSNQKLFLGIGVLEVIDLL